MKLREYLLHSLDIEVGEGEGTDDNIVTMFFRKVLNGAGEEGDVLFVSDEVWVRRESLLECFHEARVDLAEGELVPRNHVLKDLHGHGASTRAKLKYSLWSSYLSQGVREGLCGPPRGGHKRPSVSEVYDSFSEKNEGLSDHMSNDIKAK